MPDWTLITGASTGIGAEFARLAARESRKIILTARSEEKLSALRQELIGAGAVEVVTITADLSREGEAERLWQEATRGRRIERLVNNAGLGRNGAFGSEDSGGWERERQVIAVNITALTRLMTLAIPHMREAGRGQILNVASLAGFMPGPQMAVYHASKAYVLSLSEAAASELEDSGITVTALCPGPVRSEFFDRAEMTSTPIARQSNIPGPAPVARAGWDAVNAGMRVCVPGGMNRTAALATRLLPRPLAARLAGRMLARR